MTHFWTTVARAHGTDKAELHYMPVYAQLLADRPPLAVLEIGVHEGASLRMWRELCPNALIVGIDSTPDAYAAAHAPDQGILVVVGDACDPPAVPELDGPFDLIVDDGSHNVWDVARTLDRFAPRLARTGLYVIEDTVLGGRRPYPAATDDVMRQVLGAGLQVRSVHRAGLRGPQGWYAMVVADRGGIF